MARRCTFSLHISCTRRGLMSAERRARYIALQLLSVVLGAILMTSCSFLDDNDRALKSEGVTATVINDEVLTIVNKRDARIWIFPVNRDATVAINWIPWVGPGGIAPGQRQTVPFDEIAGGAPAASIEVFWWEAVFESGEQVPGSIQSFTVAL